MTDTDGCNSNYTNNGYENNAKEVLLDPSYLQNSPNTERNSQNPVCFQEMIPRLIETGGKEPNNRLKRRLPYVADDEDSETDYTPDRKKIKRSESHFPNIIPYLDSCLEYYEDKEIFSLFSVPLRETTKILLVINEFGGKARTREGNFNYNLIKEKNIKTQKVKTEIVQLNVPDFVFKKQTLNDTNNQGLIKFFSYQLEKTSNRTRSEMKKYVLVHLGLIEDYLPNINLEKEINSSENFIQKNTDANKIRELVKISDKLNKDIHVELANYFSKNKKESKASFSTEVKRKSQSKSPENFDKNIRESLYRTKKILREIQGEKRIGRFFSVFSRKANSILKEDVKKKKKSEEHEIQKEKEKLDFLLTQTEMFSSFAAKKLLTNKKKVSETPLPPVQTRFGKSQKIKKPIVQSSEIPKESLEKKLEKLHTITPIEVLNTAFEQPKFLETRLRGYQLQGLRWLVNLFEQGINGILADEMGLGKTVQAIALMSYVAEKMGVWGPFLVLAPSSVVQQWHFELQRFCPTLKSILYWGESSQRVKLRKLWLKETTGLQTSSLHVVVISYTLFIQEHTYFHRKEWAFLILDEAQSVKNSTSLRWKALLSIQSRNKLLLTGTPIQNNMNELWALLHLIMPHLFDSHEEFGKWFSKDIEEHASGVLKSLDDVRLQRLHTVLKPFMLRRLKSEVENELAPKEENLVECELTAYQKRLYEKIKGFIVGHQKSGKINMEEEMEWETIEDMANPAYVPEKSKRKKKKRQNDSVLNVVMELRKLCNHPMLLQDLEETLIPFHLNPIVPFSVSEKQFVHKIALNTNNNSSQQLLRNQSQVYLKNNNKFLLNAQPVLIFRHKENSYWVLRKRKENFQHFVTTPSEKILESALKFKKKFYLEKKPVLTHRNFTENKFVFNNLRLCSRLVTKNILSRFKSVHSKDPATLIKESGKLQKLDELLFSLYQVKDRVLIFSQMTKMIDILESFLRFRKYKFLRLDGNTEVKERVELVNKYQTDSSIFAFLLSTRAGGLGINLTAANVVVFYDSDWNPTMDAQAMDRAHRIGQKKLVKIFRLVCKDTIEERILVKAEEKYKIQKSVYSGEFQYGNINNLEIGKFNSSELKEMLLD